jgi:EAL domain-containing protein (putative c-di-GMP-specific phosphodiesterase class I)
MRALGCTVALDDVGAEVDSLAMLALLSPEVIKLDLALLQAASERRIAEIVDAVTAQAEQTGATILVERIETPRQAELADALGAQLAQGWLFGRRERITRPPAPPDEQIVKARWRPDPRDTTPFAQVAGGARVRRTTRPLLEALCRELESRARAAGHRAILLAAFQHDSAFGPEMRARFSAVAREVAFCGVVAQGIAPEPAPGVRGGHVHPADPLANEYAVAVVTPHVCGLLSAYELGTDDEGERWYEFVLTHDRAVAVTGAAALMARIGS